MSMKQFSIPHYDIAVAGRAQHSISLSYRYSEQRSPLPLRFAIAMRSMLTNGVVFLIGIVILTTADVVADTCETRRDRIA